MRIVITGTGNAATVLGRKIMQCGHQIVQVVGRNAAHARALGDLLQAPYSDNFYELAGNADIADLKIALIQS